MIFCSKTEENRKLIEIQYFLQFGLTVCGGEGEGGATKEGDRQQPRSSVENHFVCLVYEWVTI
jgi:hypothetical protein